MVSSPKIPSNSTRSRPAAVRSAKRSSIINDPISGIDSLLATLEPNRSTIIESMDLEQYANRVRVHGALADAHRLALIDELCLSDRASKELGAVVGIDSNL